MTYPKNETKAATKSQASEDHGSAREVAASSAYGAEQCAGSVFIGQRYEHSEQRRDYRCWYYMRGLDASLGRMSDLAELRTQAGYQTQFFGRFHHRDQGLDQTLGEMFIGGASLAWVGELVDTLTGAKP